MSSLELKVPPVALLLLHAVLMGLVALVTPSLTAYAVPRFVLAIILAALAATITLSGAIAFRQTRTTVNPFTPGNTTSLVCTGIYAHTRNPMYLGFPSWTGCMDGISGKCCYSAHPALVRALHEPLPDRAGRARATGKVW